MSQVTSDSSLKFSERSVYFSSLGCSKNLVDSQVMLGHLGLGGFQIVSEPQDAEVIIVNTCSFIDAAKAESVETVLDLADFKNPDFGKCQALVVSGCMAQRYSQELEQELPEVDLFIGTGEYNKIIPLLKALEEGKLNKKSFVEIPKFIHTEFDPRLNTSPTYMAWLKVSEGCNRNCTFCIIPKIRGRLRSRSVQSLVNEAKNLVANGVKEINVISQDLSDYGYDLDENNKLPHLMRALGEVEGLEWVRFFYYYPEDMTEESMDVMASNEKIVKYLDMPIQHFSSKILRRMNRRVQGKEIHEKVNLLREKIPGIVLRTSVIVGFPGETEEDFQELLQGIKELKFNHLGVFKYSDEEGTAAFRLDGKVPQDVIEDRFDQVYEAQLEIIRSENRKLVGKKVQVLIEGTHEETDLLLQGRYWGQAPDIDGRVIINQGHAKAGEFVTVEITDVLDYDFVGRVI